MDFEHAKARVKSEEKFKEIDKFRQLARDSEKKQEESPAKS